VNEKILLTHWIECDAYDRQAFERLTSESESLQALAASGSRLLPHFEGFLLDLFALLFKMNVLLHREDAVVPSAALFGFLLDQVRGAPGVQAVRQQTVLDEATAGLAALLLGESLLALLKSERVLSRGEMLDTWNLERQEEEVHAKGMQADTAEELGQKSQKEATQQQLRELQNRIRGEAEAAQRRLQQQASRMRQHLAESADRQRARITEQVDLLQAEVAQLTS
jgi:hypothetical protein